MSNRLRCIRGLLMAGMIVLGLGAPGIARAAPLGVRITTADGLPSNQVNGLVQDRQGMIWLATADGLARDDGSGFRVWRTEHGLPDNALLSLALDAHDQLWIGTAGGHVVRLSADRQRFVTWAGPLARAIGTSAVQALLPRADGTLWVGTRERGLVRLAADGTVRRFLPGATQRGLPSARIEVLAEGAQGDIWIGTAAGLARWDGEGIRRPFPVDHDAPTVTALALDAQGSVYAGSARGTRVSAASARGQAPARWVAGQLLGPGDGGHWYAQGAHLWWQEAHTDARYPLQLPLLESGLAPRIQRAVQDRHGRTWLLSAHLGVWQLGPKWRQLERAEPGTPAPQARGTALARARDGGAWRAAAGRLQQLRYAAAGPSRSWTYRHEDAGDSAPAVTEDGEGRVWIAAGRWLTRIDPRGGRPRAWPIVPAPIAQHGAPSALRACGTDRLWRLAPDAFEQRDLAGAVLGRWTHAAVGLQPGEAALGLQCTADGSVWVGDGAGLKRWDALRARFVFVPGAPRGAIGALHVDDRDRLWVATLGGLAGLQWRGGTLQAFSRLGRAQALPYLMPHALTTAGDGSVWMTTPRGLTRVHWQARNVRVFGVEDGLPPLVFGRQLIDLGARLLALDDAGGAWWIDAAGMHAAQAAPELLISELHVRRGGRAIELPVTLPLQVTTEDRDIQLAARRIAADGPAVRWRFRLQGLDPDWVGAGERGTRTFSRLPAGRHVLEFQARGTDGRWSPRQQVTLQVRRTGAAHPAARVLQCLGLLLCAAGVVIAARCGGRRRLARREGAERMRYAEQAAEAKARFLATLGHEVRTPLTGVLGMSELLLAAPLSPTQREQVQRVQQGGRQLLAVVDAALDTARQEAGRVALQARCFAPCALVHTLQAAHAPVLADRGCVLACRVHLPASAQCRGDPARLGEALAALLDTLAAQTGTAAIGVQAWSLPGRSGLLLEATAAPGPWPLPGDAALLTALAPSTALLAAMQGRLRLLAHADGTQQVLVSLPLAWTVTPPPSGPLRILLVQHDAADTARITPLLTRRGHAVRHAGHALAALTQLSRAAVDLIVLDADLPGMDGVMLLQLLRQQAHRMPALVLDRHADPALGARVMAAGGAGVLRLPLEGAALDSAIAEAVRG